MFRTARAMLVEEELAGRHGGAGRRDRRREGEVEEEEEEGSTRMRFASAFSPRNNYYPKGRQPCGSPEFMSILTELDAAICDVTEQAVQRARRQRETEELERRLRFSVQHTAPQRVAKGTANSSLPSPRTSKRRLRFSTSPSVPNISSIGPVHDADDGAGIDDDEQQEELDGVMEEEHMEYPTDEVELVNEEEVAVRLVPMASPASAASPRRRRATPTPPRNNVMRARSALRAPETSPPSPPITTTTMTTTRSTLEEDERLARQLMEEEQAEMLERLVAQQQMELQRLRSEASQGGEWRMTMETAAAVAEGEDDGEDGADPEGMSYDQLLELGERMGDVRRERWRARSHLVIARLRTVSFRERDRAAYDDEMCVICQFAFEPDEILTLMPRCRHSFHRECLTGWLRDHDTCATCKAGVEERAEEDL